MFIIKKRAGQVVTKVLRSCQIGTLSENFFILNFGVCNA